MKYLVKTGIIASLALLFANGSVLAGDYNSGIVTKSPSTVDFTDVEFGSGWYIRGDITYNLDGRSGSGSSDITTSSGNRFSLQGDYDDAIGARIGGGYYVNPNFRLELSAEGIFNSQFSGIGQRSFGGSRELEITVRELVDGGTEIDPITGEAVSYTHLTLPTTPYV